MAKFKMGVLIDPYRANLTARVADAAGAANQLRTADVGKLVRLKGDSQYGLAAAGDEIEGVLATAEEMSTVDGFEMGSIDDHSRIEVTLDGLQATPGTGAVAIGDFVVTGTVVARGTKLTGAPKVCKATAAGNTLVFAWRVVSFLSGSGAVGTVAVIERC